VEAFTGAAPELMGSNSRNQLIYSLANPRQATAASAEPSSTDHSITHIVQQGIAFDIATSSETTAGNFGLDLDPATGQWQLTPGDLSIALNGQPVTEPSFLKPGDVILTGNQTFQFIQVQ